MLEPISLPISIIPTCCFISLHLEFKIHFITTRALLLSRHSIVKPQVAHLIQQELLLKLLLEHLELPKVVWYVVDNQVALIDVTENDKFLLVISIFLFKHWNDERHAGHTKVDVARVNTVLEFAEVTRLK